MFGRKNLIGAKPAEISIEISLSIVMSVVVLFLVLSLFGNNIQNIAEASGLRNLFSRSNETAKTFQDEQYSGKNPTETQVNVQLIADQGLNYYISNAQATIAKYKKTPPVDQAQTEDLARAATIARLAGVLSNTDMTDFYKKYKIKITTDTLNSIYKTSADKASLQYNMKDGNTTGQNLITAAKEILEKDFS